MIAQGLVRGLLSVAGMTVQHLTYTFSRSCADTWGLQLGGKRVELRRGFVQDCFSVQRIAVRDLTYSLCRSCAEAWDLQLGGKHVDLAQ